MAEITRVITDVAEDQVPLQKSLLEVDGFAVVVTKQDDGLFTLTGTKDDGSS